MNNDKWFSVAFVLMFVGALLTGAYFLSQAIECSGKGGVYVTPSGSLPVCLKAEVIK